MRLKYLKKELQKDDFLRRHRSFHRTSQESRGESPAYPWDTQELEDLTEAEIYARIACQIYKTDPADIYLDKESTNSGENAENALKIIKEHGIGKQILILIQDPLLQKRASASLKRYETESRIISYAPFIPG